MTPRYEFKVPCDPARLPEIRAWVRLHPAHWRESYPPRQINNIYFDSHDLHDLNANLSGIGQREKLRLRWYGPDMTRVANAQLERKRRNGLAGWKEAVRAGVDLDLTVGTWSEMLVALRVSLEPRARLWLDGRAVPMLVTCYQRVYFETPDGVLRLTLDTQLRAYEQRFSLLPNVNRQALQPDIVVMELKAPVGEESLRRLSHVLMALPDRADRFSKYLRGMLASADFDGVVA